MSLGLGIYNILVVVQAGFYSSGVECWICMQRVAGLILGWVRSEEIFFA